MEGKDAGRVLDTCRVWGRCAFADILLCLYLYCDCIVNKISIVSPNVIRTSHTHCFQISAILYFTLLC